MIDMIFKDIKEYILYLNNILSYSGNMEAEPQAIVEKVLQQCVEHRLAINLLKSKFYVYKTIFLEQVIYGQKVKMDPAKVETMSKWLSQHRRRKFSRS